MITSHKIKVFLITLCSIPFMVFIGLIIWLWDEDPSKKFPGDFISPDDRTSTTLACNDEQNVNPLHKNPQYFTYFLEEPLPEEEVAKWRKCYPDLEIVKVKLKERRIISLDFPSRDDDIDYSNPSYLRGRKVYARAKYSDRFKVIPVSGGEALKLQNGSLSVYFLRHNKSLDISFGTGVYPKKRDQSFYVLLMKNQEVCAYGDCDPVVEKELYSKVFPKSDIFDGYTLKGYALIGIPATQQQISTYIKEKKEEIQRDWVRRRKMMSWSVWFSNKKTKYKWKVEDLKKKWNFN